MFALPNQTKNGGGDTILQLNLPRPPPKKSDCFWLKTPSKPVRSDPENSGEMAYIENHSWSSGSW